MNTKPREYGIGRVPADVNIVDEAMAELEAAEIMRRSTPKSTPSSYRPRRCMRCGAAAMMSASLGPACPDHYDELSG